MAVYRIISRGGNMRGAYDLGYSLAEEFVGALQITPQPLLEPKELQRLQQFLRTIPDRSSRRTIDQREEARSLAALVRASTADAFNDEAKDLLLRCIEGKHNRRKGRPTRIVSPLSNEGMLPLLAAELSHAIWWCLKSGQPIDLERWGRVQEDPESMTLPLKTRALTITQKVLRERGYQVPSIGRLRNRISERNVGPVGLFVKGYAGPV